MQDLNRQAFIKRSRDPGFSLEEVGKLAADCQGDDRPDCPIIKELESGCACK